MARPASRSRSHTLALHPFIEKMLQTSRRAGLPPLSSGSPQQARDMVASSRNALGPGPRLREVVDLRVPTRSGEVPARLYRAEHLAEPGLVIYLHGGGWVCGSIDDFDQLTRALASRSGCAVLSVDYRLAPENPFPAGLEDANDAVIWAHENLASLLGQSVPLVIAGDSAGANLATVSAAQLRNRINIEMQCLFYPVVDADFNRESYWVHGEGLPLTRKDMQWFFEHYAASAQWEQPDISPLRQSDLAGSPPAWIAVAEYDVLHDEGVAYAERLRRDGVPVMLKHVPGLTHGFARMLNLLPEADEIVSAAATAIRDRCLGAVWADEKIGEANARKQK